MTPRPTQIRRVVVPCGCGMTHVFSIDVDTITAKCRCGAAITCPTRSEEAAAVAAKAAA